MDKYHNTFDFVWHAITQTEKVAARKSTKGTFMNYVKNKQLLSQDQKAVLKAIRRWDINSLPYLISNVANCLLFSARNITLFA